MIKLEELATQQHISPCPMALSVQILICVLPPLPPKKKKACTKKQPLHPKNTQIWVDDRQYLTPRKPNKL